ncbi:energy-coupling factor transporter transmembrane protein EcfT [Neobittarella massiliensis]|uniref:Energy-coupling factor transporter transmembrane protein EcfT n=1 Tax=Neobittarella massiliensis (ex Bilen et al. 2018) TaxID=2041842 RepID=A0A8J6LUQ5_9FIRM|nr:energy-coupling factor transporter transmembrane component T [Neobittarella massiliensis]MBC3517009.1 energy-coupling factor transporter transmembrane protein EcfT [Neobittarella massiliensis]
MIRDITIGQYFTGHSALHRMDPRTKLVLTIAYIVVLFLTDSLPGYLLAIGLLVLCYKLAHIGLKVILRSLKPVIPLVLFTGILNMFFISGDVLWHWWIFRITQQGLYFAAIMSVRIICLIAGTSLLTYTTSPIALTDGLERLLAPLAKLHFPVHELAMMMTITLRFIPTLVEETDKIMSAQKSRGADMETGGLIKRVKALVPILIPLFVSSFRRADELALAMECRCYRGGEGRTRMRQLHMGGVDLAATAVMALICAGIILCNYLPL